MPARVHAPTADAEGQRLDLSPEEGAHVARVLRLGAGAPLRVFDGRGREWDARIAEVAAARVTVDLGTSVVPVAEPQVRYTLAAAVLKGDGTDEVVRDAVMMGAGRIRPFVATRSEARLSTLVRGGRRERWQRIAVAAAKQSGRAVVPAVEPVATFPAVVADRGDVLRVLLVEPSLGTGAVAIAALPRPASVVLAIGPEGGWTAEELASALTHGWTPVQLGPRTIRATSMALVALSACQAVWGEERDAPAAGRE